MNMWSLTARVNARLGEQIPGWGPAVMTGLAVESFRLVFRIEPATLLASLWLQVAHAISGNKAYAACARCATWWELESGANRADKRYCSVACKQAAYRDRKKQEGDQP